MEVRISKCLRKYFHIIKCMIIILTVFINSHLNTWFLPVQNKISYNNLLAFILTYRYAKFQTLIITKINVCPVYLPTDISYHIDNP